MDILVSEIGHPEGILVVSDDWLTGYIKMPRLYLLPKLYRFCKLICDAIKQNESELEKMKSQFSFSLYAPISEQYHTKIHVKIKHTVPEI